jgi:hypothetical protein
VLVPATNEWGKVLLAIPHGRAVSHLLFEHKHHWGFLRVKDIRFWWMGGESGPLMLNYAIEEVPEHEVKYPTRVVQEEEDLSPIFTRLFS